MGHAQVYIRASEQLEECGKKQHQRELVAGNSCLHLVDSLEREQLETF